MCSQFLILEIKSFVSLKNECCFFGRGYISRGESSSPKFGGVVAHKREGRGLTDLEFFLGGGVLGKKG